jgi:hypothetical protein
MKTVIEAPASLIDDIESIKSKLDQILQKDTIKTPHDLPENEWITPEVFMKSTGTKRSFFETHKGQMNTRKIARKVYVHRSAISKYFNGEIA